MLKVKILEKKITQKMFQNDKKILSNVIGYVTLILYKKDTIEII